MTSLDSSGRDRIPAPLADLDSSPSVPALSSSPVPIPPSDRLAQFSADLSVKFSPWMLPTIYWLGRHVVIPSYFSRIEVFGREHLPTQGPVIYAPTHRARWDALLVPYAAGRDITGRDLRFMVTADEVKGLQGWWIRHLGGFPIDIKRPAIASLRYGVELLHQQESLVIFPEGGIFRDQQVHPLKAGLARLALQAEMTQASLGIHIVPMHLHYLTPIPSWRSQVRIYIGKPIPVLDYCGQETTKKAAQKLTATLETALWELITASEVQVP